MYRSQSPRGNQRNWNNQKSQQLGSNFVLYNKACFVCGSFHHVQANCNYHQRERVVSGNNYTRVNYNYSAKMAYPSAHRNMVPRAVLIKTGLRSLNTARLVNTAHPKTIVYSARPLSHFSKSAQSTGTCPISQTSRNLMEDMLPLGEEPKEGKLLVKELLKLYKESIKYTVHSTMETDLAKHIFMPQVERCSLIDSSSKNAIMLNHNLLDAERNDRILLMLHLKATHADFFGDETEVDMSNITATYLVPSTPNTRIIKDHSLDHVIGDV
ncbi:hypothetical protein Tco_0994808 [Tanacetum coccineum]